MKSSFENQEKKKTRSPVHTSHYESSPMLWNKILKKCGGKRSTKIFHYKFMPNRGRRNFRSLGRHLSLIRSCIY